MLIWNIYRVIFEEILRNFVIYRSVPYFVVRHSKLTTVECVCSALKVHSFDLFITHSNTLFMNKFHIILPLLLVLPYKFSMILCLPWVLHDGFIYSSLA